jgi:hypothetical protein
VNLEVTTHDDYVNNMEARGALRHVGTAHLNHDNGVYYDYKCLNCAESERKLKEMNVKLSSLQLIVKLLYKEINSHTSTSNVVGNANPSSSSSSFEESGRNTDTQNGWTVVSSNRYN